MSMRLFSLRKIFLLLFVFCLTGFLFSPIAEADTRYIIDVLIVDVRDNMGSQYKKVANLKTGDAVEVLEETKRFVKVRTNKGVVGYIAKQYVSTDIPKAKVISNLQYEVSSLKKKIKSLQADKDGFNDKIQVLKAQNDSYKQEISGVTDELTRSLKEIENLSVQKAELQEKVDQLGKVVVERDELQATVKKLEPRISVLQQRYDQALENNKEAAELISERDDLQDKLMAVQADMEFLKEKHQKLIDESKDVVAIIAERDSLSDQSQKNETTISQLRERNDELEGTKMVYWFLAGAGVLLIGMLIGRSTARKRRSMLS